MCVQAGVILDDFHGLGQYSIQNAVHLGCDRRVAQPSVRPYIPHWYGSPRAKYCLVRHVVTIHDIQCGAAAQCLNQSEKDQQQV